MWRLVGIPSGQYLAATMDLWLPKLETVGELDAKRLTPAFGVQLIHVSGPRSTRSWSPPRTRTDSKTLRDQGRADAAELDHGPQVRRRTRTGLRFIEANLVVHPSPALGGEFAGPLTAPDVFTGWTENVAGWNGAHK